MSAPPYSYARPESIQLASVTNGLPANDLPPRHSEDSGSEISYHDNLDDEPFDEKRGGIRLDNAADEEEGEGYSSGPSRLRLRRKSTRTLAVLLGIIAFAAVIGGLAATGYSAPSYSSKGGNKHITMDHVFNGTFAPIRRDVEWVKQAPDGTFSTINERGDILLSHVQDMNATETLVEASKVIYQGRPLRWFTWELSADKEYVLFQADRKKLWRHSSHGNYYVFRLSDGETIPITTPQDPPTTTLATWAPVGHSLAYVQANDLYVVPEAELEKSVPESVRITRDGSESVLNGVPGWVYEEEVLMTDSALWWSPNGETMAFLRMDEVNVPIYKLQYYNPTSDAFSVNPYPTEADIRYPMAGESNPLVTVHTFSLRDFSVTGSVSAAIHQLTWPDELPVDSRIISEVSWVADQGLLVRETDRAARNGRIVLFREGNPNGLVVRMLGKDGEEGDDGWIDHGSLESSRSELVRVQVGEHTGYLEIVPKDGFRHVALFAPIDSTEPIWISSGEWEVTSIAGFDQETNTVYYVAARPSIDRHLYSATLPDSITASNYEIASVALSDTARPGYNEVSMSPGGGYYVLSYMGPEIPWQRLVGTRKSENGEPVNVLLESNQALNDTVAEFQKPTIVQTTVQNDGYDLNMRVMFPPNMDTSGRKKYPVFFQTYAGPTSQLVNNKWGMDWHHYLAADKKYIICVLDGRGTGAKGRALRNPVKDNLGHFEPLDQIAGAREMAKRVYVDPTRIGIWGWSGGGYMTLKTLEARSGIFSLGIAVAAVTDFSLYDTVYSERFMNLPSLNAEGYHNSAVNNVTAFGEVDLAFAHGSGDDNVHFSHIASLIDRLTQTHTRGWRFRMFTDSDHRINTREAYRELYEWMTEFLDEKWGQGGHPHRKLH